MKQFLAFSSVGAVGTAGHYITLIVLVRYLLVSPVYATAVGFFVGAIINYLLNYRFTFRSQKRHLDALPKFMTIAISTSVANSMIMYVGTQLSLHYLLVQITATVLLLFANYSFNKIWTFSN